MKNDNIAPLVQGIAKMKEMLLVLCQDLVQIKMRGSAS